MFNKKSKQIESLKEELQVKQKEVIKDKKEIYNDFISVLKQIQEFTNGDAQWKRKKIMINNAVGLAEEYYYNKMMELDTNTTH